MLGCLVELLLLCGEEFARLLLVYHETECVF